ncbi:hypothetical protein BC826DRAFT_484215 [Russula brevipes]|nr:hypothetical protein BC826DRAFT_484215 [Russula brevipes]
MISATTICARQFDDAAAARHTLLSLLSPSPQPWPALLMPKRAATPPPPDDEPRYVVVVHPYPLHANLLQHEDRRTLALWLACCTGKDVLLAMFYKPTSPGMVIVEVDRDFDRFESLLGMHAWSDFLLKPTREEEGKSSRYTGVPITPVVWWRKMDGNVYTSRNTGSQTGVLITRGSSTLPNNYVLRPPPEAKTGMPLCRPLPQASFPRPAPQTKPPGILTTLCLLLLNPSLTWCYSWIPGMDFCQGQ